MSDSYCKQCRDSGRVDHGGMIIPCPLCLDRKNANTTTVISKTELTRLLAIEVAAKEAIGMHFDWSHGLKKYVCLHCHNNGDYKNTINHGDGCPVLVINPIGDK